MPHPSLHFVWTIGLLVATMAMLAIVRTRHLKRRLSFAGVAFVLAAALHFLIDAGEGQLTLQAVVAQGPAIEYMLIAFGIVAGVVALILNPWSVARPDRGVPSIVQDAVVVLLSCIGALFFFQNSSFLVGVTGSFIVFGLALQDQLGNAFAGLALQVERPFRVGHWVTVAGHEGRVVEVTWRATKIATKSGNLVVLPNSEIAKAGITNFSQPAAPTQLVVDVGIAYETPPNEARSAIMTAVRRIGRVLRAPEPEVLLIDFAASSIVYRAQVWIGDFEAADQVRSEVRTAIYYELGRRGIEIPFPIQVEYSRELPVADRGKAVEQARRMINAVPVFAGLPDSAQRALAEATNARLFADGEEVVREGEAGATMYLVKKGQVVVTVGPTARQVAVTSAGGYFGEMSLLTGQPRTATVTASGDSVLLEIAAEDFKAYVQGNPDVIEHLATAAAARQRELDAARAVATTDIHVNRQSLVDVMRRFFGLE